jgi:cell division septal protein FtsQ
LSNPEVRRLIRQWDREIDEERRAEAARARGKEPWRAVSWFALWLLWLAVLVMIAGIVRPLR